MAKKFKLDGLVKAAEEQKAAIEKQEKIIQPSIKDKIIIWEDLKNLIPPLATDEYEKLEDNILAEGCRDALIVWKHENEYILIDGHNRYSICTRHNLDFNVQVMEFENLDEVSDWMVNNQLGKRNVTEETKSYLRGLQYSREKKKVGGTGANQYNKQLGQNVPTAERLAQQHKVSEKTIKRDEQFALAIEKITAGNKNLKWDILNKKIALPKVAATTLSKEDDEFAKKIGEFLAEGISFNEAVSKTKQSLGEIRQKNVPPSLEQLKQLKAHIIACINEAIKKEDPKPLEDALKYLQEMEENLKN